MSYLRYLCLLTYGGVQHILCCVFALFFFVLCTLCCQFLWIVHFLIAPSVFCNVFFYLHSQTVVSVHNNDIDLYQFLSLSSFLHLRKNRGVVRPVVVDHNA